MASYKALAAIFVALFAVVMAAEEVREKRGLAYGGLYGGYGYPSYGRSYAISPAYHGIGYSGLGYSGLGYRSVGYSGLGYRSVGYSGLGYSGLGYSGLGYSGLGYSSLGYSGLGYHGGYLH